MSYITEPSRPVLAARLKTATTAQRQQLAEIILDADPGNSNSSNADDMIEFARALAEHRQGMAPPTMPQLPKFLFANLALDSDPSVAFAAEDVLFRADVASLDRAKRAASTRVVTPPPEAASIAKQATDPDPKVRGPAILAAAEQPGLDDLVLAALKDPEPAVRGTANLAAARMLSRDLHYSLDRILKILDLAEHDPAYRVRDAASTALDRIQRDRLGDLWPR